MKKSVTIPLFFLLLALLSLNACKNRKKEKTTETKDTTSVIIVKGDTIIKEKIVVIYKEKKEGEVAVEVEKEVMDPLPSWNDTKHKKRIINFVKAATTEGSDNYVTPEERIATFDNDGTLWSEKPTYFQIEFVLYRIKQLAPKHPEWKKNKLIQAALNHNLETLRKKYGANGMEKLVSIAQAGLTTVEFEKIVNHWIHTAKHPTTGKLYIQMVYQPMLELIRYLQDNGFKVYIVSSGGIDFMRVWGEKVYGIPRNHILGSVGNLNYEYNNGKPVLIKSPEIMFVNDGPEKPVAIHQFIGEKPLVAFGNSDGDLQMLEWCNANKYQNLPAYIHHTDAKREWAYDRESRIGTLNKGLDAAKKNNWLIVDMKNDWKVIHPYELNDLAADK